MRSIPRAIRRKGRRLLHQQCWNWGRDVVRPAGNLLLARYGLEYRCRVLQEWKEARQTIPPELLPHAWRELAERLDAVAERRSA